MERSLFDKLAALDRRHWMVYAKELFAAPYIGPREDARILDAGCGTGPMLAFFAEAGSVVGMDSSRYALSLARAGAPAGKAVTFVECDVARMPFPDGHFDAVALFDVLYHRAVEDDEDVIRECCRVLRRGGRLMVIDSAFKFLKTSYDEEAHVARRYRLAEMKRKFAKAGLRVKKASYIFFFIFPAVAAIRFLHNALRIRVKESEHMFRIDPLSNAVMRFVMRVEALMFRVADLPWGTSLFCVGVKEG
jgi:ubiquinone/menaquinone biosynthesis C-methylase UbiE